MPKIILVADDSVTMQTVAEITFRATDYTYVGARSVDEAVDKARHQKPALVLADSLMPGKTGYDLCHAIKTDARLSDVPVVILCGNSAPFDPAKGSQSGADGTLAKPWDTQVMLEKVAEFIDKASSGVAKPGVASAAVTAAASAPPPSQPVATPRAVPAPTPISTQSAARPTPTASAAAAAAAAAANQPPRSATIMGMPTIKFPAGPGAPATPAVPPAPPKSPGVPPITSTTAPVTGGGSSIASAAAAGGSIAAAVGRPPMVSGTPTKRSALVERTLAKMAARLAEAAGLEPGSPELLALLKLSTEVVERVVWEVVPELAEQIIRENLQELTARRGGN
jgi:CheY-like chemotaxis protein